MKLVSTRVYSGRNIYSHWPVIRIDVDVEEYLNIPSCDITDFNEKLLTLLPGLNKHKCSKGYEGGFVERLKVGTYLPHILEHMAIEIQNILGYNTTYGKTRYFDNETIYTIVFTYEDEIAGIEAAKLAYDIILAFLNKEKAINLNNRLTEIREKIRKNALGPSTMAIVTEAEKRGIPVNRLGNNSLIQLGYGKYLKRIQATITDNTSCIAADTACDKQLTKDILKLINIPVPKGNTVNSLKEAKEIAEQLGYPVVIKPYNGNQGKGVSINIKSSKEVENAFYIAEKFSPTVMVEEFIEGKHYRAVVVDNQIVAVAERIAAHVIGNGINSIKELVEIENSREIRGFHHEKPLTKIPFDDITKEVLRRRDLNEDHIPVDGEVIFLRENANLSTGGTSIDVTDKIHPDNIRMVINAAAIIGLDVAGVDITTPNISMPIIETGGAIIEINACPGIRMHHYPSIGKTQNVAEKIVDYLFPPDKPHSIPIISVTGTNGKTTTTRMLASILRKNNLIVGMTTTGGIYIQDELIMKGDTTGPISAKAILMDKRVEIAVLETARGGIINRGLAYDKADVGIITNIGDDHLGLDGINTHEEMARVKSIVVEAVKDDGYAVLNAEDEYLNTILEGVRCPIIFFSGNHENQILVQHMSQGGKAVYVKDSKIYIFDGEKSNLVIEKNEIPATFNGVLTYNTENSMAAIAAAYAVGVNIKIIKAALEEFNSDVVSNPGRFNVFQLNGFKVIVDYGHNIDGYVKVLEGLSKIKAGRLVGVIGIPGDRTDINIVKVGEISGKYFDYVYVKEDKDLRGRKKEEVANLLKKGCIVGGISEDKIRIQCCEIKALEMAIENAVVDDIIVVFYEEYEPLINLINEYMMNENNSYNQQNGIEAFNNSAIAIKA